MKKLALLLSAIGAVTCLSTAVSADWGDDFDSYATGSGMHGQGGWKGWDSDPTWDAFVSDAYSLSAPNSVDIMGDADLVHEFAGYTSGQWTFTTSQYIPGSFQGLSYFLLLNTYVDGGPNNWSTQISFDSATGLVESGFEGATLPMIYDDWVELRVDIDLDTDVQDIYYGGALLSSKSWVEGVSGGGAFNIGAVDLFANGASSIYYDDMSLVPAPGSALLLILGFGATRRRRR